MVVPPRWHPNPGPVPRGTRVSWAALCVLALIASCERGGSPEVPVAADAARTGALRRMLEGADGVMVIAHRACWRLAPENSVKAIEECARIGADFVEIDVRRTRDDHLVVIHDETVDRTTDGRGLVAELALAEIRMLRLRMGAGGEGVPLTEFRVPTLGEALEAARGRVLINLDAKDDVRDDAFRLARQLGVADQVLIKMPLSAPDIADLERAEFYGNAYFMPIVREADGDLGDQVASLESTRAVAYEVIYRTEEQLADACTEAARQDSRCWVNTMWDSLSPGHSDDVSATNPDEHWGLLVDLGVNMFQTDRPELLIEYLASRGWR